MTKAINYAKMPFDLCCIKLRVCVCVCVCQEVNGSYLTPSQTLAHLLIDWVASKLQ